MSWLTKLDELSVVEVSGYTGMLLHKVLASCRLVATRNDSCGCNPSCRLVATRNGGCGCSSSACNATDVMDFVIVKWWSQMIGPETMDMASVKCINARIGRFSSCHEVQ